MSIQLAMPTNLNRKKKKSFKADSNWITEHSWFFLMCISTESGISKGKKKI